MRALNSTLPLREGQFARSLRRQERSARDRFAVQANRLDRVIRRDGLQRIGAEKQEVRTFAFGSGFVSGGFQTGR